MAKKKLKEWKGPLEDLVRIDADEVSELWVVRLKGKTYKLGKNIVYTTETKAKSALIKHLYGNYCQGHYWHEGRDNTFAHEKGWMHNGGKVAGLEKVFKVMARETANWLLEENIFEIERIKV